MQYNSDEQLDELTDQDLIASYLHGDKKALEVLIKRYLSPIFGFIYQYVNNSQDAEDITQEVFVKVWRNLKQFNPAKSRFRTLREKRAKSFKTWIFAIAKNTAIDFLRRKKTVPFSQFDNEQGKNAIIETLADSSLLPDQLSERADIMGNINQAIAKLSLKYQQVLALRYNDQLTFDRIAEILGEPIDTVKSRNRRALIQLRKNLS